MTAAELDGDGEQAGYDWARMAALVIADELTGHDLDVRSPGWDGSEYLKVTSAPGMLCEVWVSASGQVEWECSPSAGRQADPACTAGRVLGILGAGAGAAASGRAAAHAPGCRCAVSFEGAAGRVLAGHGMRVVVRAYLDQELFEAYSEIEVTNPARPERGTVHVAGDGSLIWRCRARTSPGDDTTALDPAQVAGIIARALTGPASRVHSRHTARCPRASEFARPALLPGQPGHRHLRDRHLSIRAWKN